jgi:hypothetical protein
MKSDRRGLFDPANKQKTTEKKFFVVVKPYYANPDITFNSSW